MDLSIIIVNYNVKEFLQNLIQSIYKAVENLSYEIIIVDNCSDDGSVDFIKSKFPEVTLIANKENLGFSKANNIGLKESRGDYLLLLNPDTVVGEDTLARMINFLKENNEVGLASCKILNPDGTLQLACRRSFPGPWTSFCRVTGLSSLFPKSRLFARYNLTYLDENESYEVDAISGSFMVLPRNVYEKIGGLDEQFFMYGEDLDFCYRVQKAGFKVFYFHDAQIIHYKGESTKRSSLDETKIFYSAMHLFVKKHLSSSLLVEIILRIAIGFRKFFAFLGKRKLVVFSIILDFLFFDISLFFSQYLYSNIRQWYGFPNEILIYVYTFPAILHIIAVSLVGVYKRDSLSVLKNFLGIFLAFFLLSSFTFFFKQFAYSRAVVIITYFFLFFTLTTWRVVFKLFFKIGMKGSGPSNRHTLVVGINNSAVQIAYKLKSKQSDLFSIVGLIGLSQREVGQKIEGFDVIGSVENINKIIKEKKITDVIFSSNELSYSQMMSVVSNCQDENVEFKLVGNNLDFLVGKTSVSILDDLPLFDIKYHISDPFFKFVKKLFDYTLAAFVLFFIYPFIYLSHKLNKNSTDFTNFILKVPGIFNKGYSFVGPKKKRPENKLYLGKQGLTGLWYIENSNNVDFENLDIYYAKNQNIWFDLEILGKSLLKMWNK